MTGIKWKQQVNRDGDKVENCWVTDGAVRVTIQERAR